MTVPTANDRTRPPLDLEALREKVVAAMPWYDESNPDYTELDAVLLAAYQPTGPDDLAGLREALTTIIGAPDHDQCRRNGTEAEVECIVEGLREHGVTLTGVRSSECRCADGHPDPAGLAAGTALHALGCPAGVRSSEVDGHQWVPAKGSVAPDDLQVCAHPGCPAARSLMQVAALTGDTGPTPRSSEVDGLREAADAVSVYAGEVDYALTRMPATGGRYTKAADRRLREAWQRLGDRIDRLAALTGDTGPKVEPEP